MFSSRQLLVAFVFILLSLGADRRSAAQENVQRQPKDPICDYEQKICKYFVSNVPANTLINRVAPHVFQGLAIVSDSEKFLQQVSNTQINFWHTDPATLNWIIESLKINDSLLKPSRLPVIEVIVELMMVSEEMYRKFEIGFTSLDLDKKFETPADTSTEGDTGASPVNPILNSGLAGIGSGGMNLAIAAGNVTFSSMMAFGRSQNQIQSVDRVFRQVNQEGSIGFEKTSKETVQTTLSSTVDLKDGFYMSGSVQALDSKDGLIAINNFAVDYYVRNKVNNAIVQTISVPSTNFEIKPGISYAFFSTSTEVLMKEAEKGLAGGGHLHSFRKGHMMVFVQARSYRPEEYLKRADTKVTEHIAWLTEKEIEALPKGDGLDEILNSLTPYVFPLNRGDVILGFRLDKNLLTKGNYNTSIDVKIKGYGTKIEGQRRVQHLALGQGYTIKEPMPIKLMGKKLIKLKAELKITGTRKKVVIPLLFNRETGEFLRTDLQ